MSSNAKTAEWLGKILADSYVLYLKTQYCHWNVTGPQFASLHMLFEQQYTELAAAVDVIAERIRALGKRAPGSFSEFLKLTVLKEAEDGMDASAMLRTLYGDQQALAKRLGKALKVAQEEGDEISADVLIARLTAHEKNAWMLNASL